MKKELENYEQWLVKEEIKKEGTAESYKRAIPKLEEHYQQFTGRSLNFLNLSVEELSPIVQAYRQDGKYSDFGNKSNGTYRNTLNALLRYKEWLQKKIKLPFLSKIKNLLQTPHFQKLLTQEEFYFQKLTNLYEKYKSIDTTSITKEINNLLSSTTQDTFNFQKLLDKSSGNLKNYLTLIGKMIAIFDDKGYNKQNWNPYQDKRTVARGMFRQNLWLKYFLEYKINNLSIDFLNTTPHVFRQSIEYIQLPETNVNIVSKSHKEDIIAFFNLNNEEALINLFEKEIAGLLNPQNRGVIISHLLYNYEVKNEWLRSIIGLMASDGSGWLPNFSKQSKNFKHSIIWNHRAPSGTSNTIKALRNIINNGNTFNIYITDKGFLNYVANVIDFAENEDTYIEKDWKAKYGEIYEHQSLFENYIDGSKKASIVFLCSEVNKVNPIPDNEFDIYGNYSKPRQGNLTPIQSVPEIQIQEIKNTRMQNGTEKVKEMKEATNQILYGPPGTGKTYQTKKLAVELIDKKDYGDSEEDRKEIVNRYNQLYEKGQIVFTTFHQSMSYEDFVEGIKPKTKNGHITYEIEDGIFKKICNNAKLYSTDEITSVAKKVDFEKRIKKLRDDLELSENSEIEIAMTKTTYHITSITDKHIKFRKASGGTGHDLVIGTLKSIALGERDIIGGLRSYYDYLIQFLNTYNVSDENIEENKPFVLIIDEINRGNVSAIFGELITLLEPDKRLGTNEEITVTLPYSKSESKFGIPSNLHIIGTMNTADRSVEALDTALRRRFEFKEILPKPSLLELEIGGISLKELLETINKRIEILLDRDHTIGHSYFIKLKENDIIGLKNAFKNNIIPLLQEYFYGDYEKIGLVLGKGFFNEETLSFDKEIFASFDTQNYPEKGKIFHLKTIDTDFDIIKAINILLKKTVVNE